METKVCRKCGRELPITEFYKNKLYKDGYMNMCKKCNNAYSNESHKKKREQQRQKSLLGGAEVGDKKHKVYTNPILAPFTPRELMLELKARGYVGELLFVEHIVKEHRINLGKLD